MSLAPLVATVDHILGPGDAMVDSYPDAIDPAAVGTCPALTKAGGGYFFDEILEYRLWVHPRGGGSDYYCAFSRYADARKYSVRTAGAEVPLVLIRQKEYVDEHEPDRLIHVKADRVAEWRVEWLDRGPRRPGQIEEFIARRLAARGGDE